MPHHYDKLEVYHDSMDLCKSIYRLFASIEIPEHLETHIFRTAISIPSNIAEGAERSSNQDFARFLNYSAASCAELLTQLNIWSLILEESSTPLQKIIEETSLLKRRLKTLEKTIRPTKKQDS